MQTSELKERVLAFLNENQKAFNLSWISEQAGGISNFQQIVKGHRKLPDEYVKPLARLMTKFGFNADFEQPATTPASDISSQHGLFFEQYRDGIRIQGLGLHYERTKDSYEATLHGTRLTNPKLTSNLIMVDRMAEGTIKLLNS